MAPLPRTNAPRVRKLRAKVAAQSPTGGRFIAAFADRNARRGTVFLTPRPSPSKLPGE